MTRDIDNIFQLYSDDPNLQEAQAALKKACVSAAKKIVAVQDRYEKCGAADTDSRTAITDYIWYLLLCDGDESKAALHYKKLEPQLSGWKD